MATVSNLTQTIVQGAMSGFSDKLAPLLAFSYQVDSEGSVKGDSINVPFVATPTTSSVFSNSTGYNTNHASVTGKQVTLDKLFFNQIDLTDAEIARLSPEVLTRLSKQAGQRLATDFMSSIFSGVISNANFANSSSYTGGQFTSSVAYSDLVKKADDLKWDDNRFIIAGTSLWQSFMNNATFTQAYAFGGPEAVRDGKLPSIYGFQPYKTTLSLPASDTGFAANPNAIVVAMGYNQPAEDSQKTVEAYKSVDPNTGLVLGFRSWYDANYGTTRRVLEILGGYAVADSTALLHIK